MYEMHDCEQNKSNCTITRLILFYRGEPIVLGVH